MINGFDWFILVLFAWAALWALLSTWLDDDE
jgi:hypothetical protein